MRAWPRPDAGQDGLAAIAGGGIEFGFEVVACKRRARAGGPGGGWLRRCGRCCPIGGGCWGRLMGFGALVGVAGALDGDAPLLSFNSEEGSASMSACTPCHAGTYSEAYFSSVCTPCPSGTSSALSGASNISTCVPCPVGTYAVAGLPECLPCGPGSFYDAIGSSCASCPAGSYSSSYGSTSCRSCGPNTFASDTGLEQCETCPIGFQQLIEGATGCDPCDDSLRNLPVSLVQTLYYTETCHRMEWAVPINWLTMEQPLLFGGTLSITPADVATSLPSWMSVRTVDVSMVLFSVGTVPPSVAHTSISFDLEVNQNCRASLCQRRSQS